MSPLSIVLLSLAMSTDAFAAAIGKGTALQKPRWSEALRTGAIFGVIEAVTPVIGWALGLTAANYVRASDHWIAFGLLVGLGLRMVYKGLTAPTVQVGERLTRHPFWLLALTGFATSIDAMAVGVGLAFINVNVLPIAAAIGFTTFVAVTAGVMVGRVLGTVAGKWAEVCGGILLTGIGVSILIEHLGVG
ncbi:MAG: manganese efflux pump [Burkholderiaceae bacterium]|nr:manganese efflux pump [Burkholderiaceae bacterium]